METCPSQAKAEMAARIAEDAAGDEHDALLVQCSFAEVIYAACSCPAGEGDRAGLGRYPFEAIRNLCEELSCCLQVGADDLQVALQDTAADAQRHQRQYLTRRAATDRRVIFISL